MYQPYRAAARSFTRRISLFCAVLTAAFLLLALGAWLKAFTEPPSPDSLPVALPPTVTVTVTVTASPPRRTSGRASAAFSLPPGTDGAAQAACSARAQAAALRGEGRRAEASAQAKAAEEAALASSVPALRSLKKHPAEELPARLDTWCLRHFPGLGARPLPPSPRPGPTAGRGTRPVSEVCRSYDSYARGLDPARPDLGDSHCVRR